MTGFEKINEELFDFLDRSPVSFYAVNNMREALAGAGFTELREGEEWALKPGGSYFVTRNQSSLIAFKIPRDDYVGFQIIASHCDSPVFKVKPNAEIFVDQKYIRLNVEKYGGMLCAPWLDRPLSVAGRVVVETEDEEKGGCTRIETRLVNVDRDLLIIPNVAIHMNREANDGFKYNAQVDLLPLFSEVSESSLTSEDSKAPENKSFSDLIAKEAGVRPDRILDADLYLYNREKASYVGLNREFIASPRLDDLQCAFASLYGFLAAKPSRSVAVHCVFDNEEVGSGTRQGAGSTFLKDVLLRIHADVGRGQEDYLRALASSFMVSLDNAHGVHPNHPEKADPTNRPCMNRGIVIKYSANQKYTTDAVSGAVFRHVCKKAGLPFQTFANRSDMIGGSTLGNISQAQVAVLTVDAGLAQLAMHSPLETAGARDTAYLAEAARIIFSGSLESSGDGTYRLDFQTDTCKQK